MWIFLRNLRRYGINCVFVPDAPTPLTFQVKAAEMPFTLILDDPLANSYLQSLYAPDPDPNMKFETYERSWQQNEELGLNDMITEGYQEGHAKEMAQLRLQNDKEEAPHIEDTVQPDS